MSPELVSILVLIIIFILATRIPVKAGDSFNGCLMYSLSEWMEWPEALRFATHLASTTVSRTSEDRYSRLEEIIPMP
jgi:fructose-1-phosphate kinase PfkB-like protein